MKLNNTPNNTPNEPDYMGTKWSPEEDRLFKEEMKQLYLKSEEQIPQKYRVNGRGIAIPTPVIQTPIPVVDTYLKYDVNKYDANTNAQMTYARANYSYFKFNQIVKSLRVM